MGKSYHASLQDLDAVENGAAVEVSHLEDLAVMVGGTFVGTWEIQQSWDGTTFVAAPTNRAAITSTGTAAKTYVFDAVPKQIRVICSAYTSGTIKVGISGRDLDRVG